MGRSIKKLFSSFHKGKPEPQPAIFHAPSAANSGVKETPQPVTCSTEERTVTHHYGEAQALGRRSSVSEAETPALCPSVRSQSTVVAQVPTAQSSTPETLWNRAYQELQKEQQSLLESYEELLNQALPKETGKSTRNHRLDMQELASAGLKRMDDRKLKYTIAGQEYTVADQVALVSETLVKLKSFIADSVSASPQASMAWAGISILLPLFTNHSTVDLANKSGFNYVASRMRFYIGIEELRWPKNLNISAELRNELEDAINELYKAILTFQIESTLRFYRNAFSTILRDTIKWDDWKAMSETVKEAEATVTKYFTDINDIVLMRSLENLENAATENYDALQKQVLILQQHLRASEGTNQILQNMYELQSKAFSAGKLDIHGAGNKSLERADTGASDKSFNDLELKCIALLNGSDPALYDEAPPNPIADTCQWIRRHDTFVSWLENENNGVLWLTGHPGCGKTVISSYIAQSFCETEERSQTVLLYFCQDKNRQTDAIAVLIGLIFQIVDRHHSLIKHVRRAVEMHQESMFQSFNLVWALFLRILRDPRAGFVFVIIDALDECERDSCQKLLKSISRMLSNFLYSVQKGVRVKFLLTSRPHLYDSFAATEPNLQQRLSIDDGQSGYVDDLHNFVRLRVDEICQKRQFSKDINGYLYQQITLKADGTFLWIHIVLESIEESFLTAKTNLENIIAGIPEDLAQIYKQFLATIPSKYQHFASSFLKLLLGSSRALALDEFNVAYTLTSSHISHDDVMRDTQSAIAHTVQSILGPLIRVSASQISLVHQSLKEFLLSQSAKDPGSFPAVNSIDVPNAALLLATTCIRYLLLEDFQTNLFASEKSPTNLSSQISNCLSGDEVDYVPAGIWDEEDPALDAGELFGEPCVPYADICDSISSRYPFYSYAALHWTEHFAVCEEIAPAELQDAARSLLDIDVTYCLNWLQFYRTRSVNSLEDDDFNKDRILLASQFNSKTTLEHLLSEYEASMLTKNRSLCWAARLGHDKIVNSLLRAGANPNHQALERQTALTLACKYGNSSCVDALLADERTDINTPGFRGTSALSYACGGGYDEIVRKLLKHGKCKDSQPDDDGETPFFWAVGGGHASTVSILARRPGVNINHRAKSGRTALSQAAGDGMVDILTKLLSLPGIDANMADNKGRSPLSWAAGNGQLDSMDMLLETAKVNKATVDNDKRTAISWACGGGHHAVLVKLLDAQCPGIDTVDIDGWTPLMWAIQKDSPDTVQTLIDSKQVQLERRDRGGRTALQWAIEYRQARVVDTLRRAGAGPSLEISSLDNALPTVGDVVLRE